MRLPLGGVAGRAPAWNERPCRGLRRPRREGAQWPAKGVEVITTEGFGLEVAPGEPGRALRSGG